MPIQKALSRTTRSVNLYIGENILPHDRASSSNIAGILMHVFRANDGTSVIPKAKGDDLT